MSYIYRAATDLDFGGNYQHGVLELTSKELIIYKQSTDRAESFELGGYGENMETLKTLESAEWNIMKCIPLSNILELEVQILPNGGILLAKRRNQEELLATFTNTAIGEVKHLIKLFKKIRDGEEILAEDTEPKHREICCPKCHTRYPDPERKICPKCMNTKSAFSRTLLYFKPYTGKIVIMLICYVGTALLNLVWPYLNGTILYDQVLGKNEAFLKFFHLRAGRYITLLGIVVIMMALTKLMIQLLGMLQGYFTARIVPSVLRDIKGTVFQNMGKLSVGFYNSRQTGSLMTRVLDDSERVASFFIDGLPYFFINLFSIITMCIVMFSINVRLAVMSVILLPLLSVISIKMLPRLWHKYGKRHRAARSMNAAVNDNLVGARVVKAFGQEENEVTRFQKYNNRVKQSELELVAYDNRYKALYTTVENISTFIVWGVGSVLVLGDTAMPLGMLITFVGYVAQLKDPLDFMSGIFRQWTESMNSAARIFEIIDSIPDIQDAENAVFLSSIQGEIELSHVTFGYEPHKPVLQDVSFHIKPGEMLGIVGRSGAGKSTLVNLIARLYDVWEGEIFIDGINIKQISLQDLHRHIAMVSQETYIFMGTVAENIAYAKKNATREEILYAAKMASAHDFIMEMPDGYDTVIGSSGRDLSGGQRQRISIARAILANPKILILDEATAAVDTETEAAIQRSIDRLIEGRTTLSIAHRLSTLRNADYVVVIDEGRVSEAGTHQQLLEKKGTYFKLMELQTKALVLRGIE